MLTEIPGVTVKKPHAAFYIFPKLDEKKFGIKDDMKFAFDLLHEKKILVTQGTGFNLPTPDHFRIVFLPNKETLTRACRSIGEFLADYHQ